MKSTLMLVRQIQGRGISLKTKSRGRTAQLINFSIMTNSSCFFSNISLERLMQSVSTTFTFGQFYQI